MSVSEQLPCSVQLACCMALRGGPVTGHLATSLTVDGLLRYFIFHALKQGSSEHLTWAQRFFPSNIYSYNSSKLLLLFIHKINTSPVQANLHYIAQLVLTWSCSKCCFSLLCSTSPSSAPPSVTVFQMTLAHQSSLGNSCRVSSWLVTPPTGLS